MDWQLLLGGEWGQNSRIGEHEDRIRWLRTSFAAGLETDLGQDAQIDALWRENVNLKVALGSLVRLLVARGVVDESEIAELVQVLERAEAVVPVNPLEQIPPDEAPTQELAELSRAVREVR